MNRDTFDRYTCARNAGDNVAVRKLMGELIRQNLPFVQTMVQRHIKHSTHCDRSDLVQAGTIGLIRAIEKYDPEKAAFTTHAAFWIRHEIQTCIAKHTSGIRRNHGMPLAISQKRDVIEAKTGRAATADELGIKDRQLTKWSRKLFFNSLDVKTGETFRNHRDRGTGEESLTLLDTLPCEREPLDEQASKRQSYERMFEAVNLLSEREKRVIYMIFFEDREYDEVCVVLGLGRERVRQLRLSALEKIREHLAA